MRSPFQLVLVASFLAPAVLGGQRVTPTDARPGPALRRATPDTLLAAARDTNLSAPTVLPTIIGPRRKAANRHGGEGASRPATYPTVITAAGPVVTVGGSGPTNAAAASFPAVVQVIQPVLVEVPVAVPVWWGEGRALQAAGHQLYGRYRSGELSSLSAMPGAPRLAPPPDPFAAGVPNIAPDPVTRWRAPGHP